MELIYYPQKGYGILPIADPFVYDLSYFEEFARRAKTKRGQRLNSLRALFVREIVTDREGLVFVDCGVGSGAFIELAESMLGVDFSGYDVASNSIEWLYERERWHQLSRDPCDVATFWDSLEHCQFPEAERLLRNVRHFAFISMPIYENGDAIVHSKHFKPGEHILYFTERGLVGWMKDQGFELIARNRIEESCGRDGIGTYAFVRP